MKGGNIFAGTLGILIVIGLIVLIIIQSTTPTRVKTITRTEILPVPSYRIPTRNHRRTHRQYPYQPQPYQPNGHRNTPFCEHTANGCYPGTQTPIP